MLRHPICPIARKERGKLRGQGCWNVAGLDFWKTRHITGWHSQRIRLFTQIYTGLSETAFHNQKGSCIGKGDVWRQEGQWPYCQYWPSLRTPYRKGQGDKICRIRCKVGQHTYRQTEFRLSGTSLSRHSMRVYVWRTVSVCIRSWWM